MKHSTLSVREIEELVHKKGPGLVMINALELPWIEISQFETAMEGLIECGKLRLHDKVGDWVMGNLTHSEVEIQTVTKH